jgi:hypothetical protein
MAAVSKINFLHRERTCNCGHPMKYHIKGELKCVFGICDCDKYCQVTN